MKPKLILILLLLVAGCGPTVKIEQRVDVENSYLSDRFKVETVIWTSELDGMLGYTDEKTLSDIVPCSEIKLVRFLQMQEALRIKREIEKTIRCSERANKSPLL